LIGRKPVNLIVGWCGRFLFFVVGEWPENQILILDWTYFHCPDTTLVGADHFYFLFFLFFKLPEKQNKKMEESQTLKGQSPEVCPERLVNSSYPYYTALLINTHTPSCYWPKTCLSSQPKKLERVSKTRG